MTGVEFVIYVIVDILTGPVIRHAVPSTHPVNHLLAPIFPAGCEGVVGNDGELDWPRHSGQHPPVGPRSFGIW